MVNFNEFQPIAPEMDENGECVAKDWSIRRALRSRAGENILCYIVSYPGEVEYICRDFMYGSYLLSKLRQGQRRENLRNERAWLLDEARPIRRSYSATAALPHIFTTKSGVVLKRLGDDLTATAWHKWYEARRKVILSRRQKPKKSGPYADYLVFRSQETLDKSMDDRVYELKAQLAGTEELDW